MPKAYVLSGENALVTKRLYKEDYPNANRQMVVCLVQNLRDLWSYKLQFGNGLREQIRRVRDVEQTFKIL